MPIKNEKNPSAFGKKEQGFTLIEVLVAMLIASIVIGGVMGLFSQSLRFAARLDDKNKGWGILEAAAAQILTDPESALQESFVPDYIEDENAEVSVLIREVTEVESGELKLSGNGLFRIALTHQDNSLEFSMLIPDDIWDKELGNLDRRSVDAVSSIGFAEDEEDEE